MQSRIRRRSHIRSRRNPRDYALALIGAMRLAITLTVTYQGATEGVARASTG